jgi:hypothetical protein
MPMRYGWWGTSKERREREREKEGMTETEEMMHLCYTVYAYTVCLAASVPGCVLYFDMV